MICASLTGAVPAVGGGAAAAQCSFASRSPRCTLASVSFAAPNSILSNGIACKRPQMLTRLPPAAAAAVAAAEAEESLGVPVSEDEGKEVGDSSHSLQVAAKGAVGKPRLVLKFIWMEKNIGLALDHVIPGHGAVPLSPYYFWPRKDAWEELKTLLESKPWISQKRMIILLNQATDIINLWQQSGAGNLQQ
ncbi:unnamed protein product [Spirodela intermedia]|uniref:30S ribosomal protein 3, chloroplastic n=1 Tax=Spirodela intermedia TaxID=51605 RepID=A0A7I8IMD5_SPIIN|nr:unnamed protein product [Spirodela intermedia]CAA6658919.1 unnamed protein product [Spirodela intermedia]